jgi:RHS repeat-associated protein
VDNRVTVRWTNDTPFSLPAPLFQVSVDVGTIRFPGTAPNGGKRVDVLGISPQGPAGVLAPGATGSTDLVVRGVGAHEHVTYFVADIGGSDTFDAGEALTAFLSDGVPAAAKSWVASEGPALLGIPRVMTAGAFQDHLGDVATLLSGLGRRVPEVTRLMAYDTSRITDSGRLEGFSAAEFGLGQPGLALPRLAVDGSDVVITAGGQRLRFARQANGTYASPPSVGDVLVASGSGWSLVARDGTRRTFSAAGLLVSHTDRDLRVATFAYTASRLTAITHPGGDTTSYAYDGSGRITSVTDPSGAVRTYAYDATGHESSVTSRGRSTTSTWDADNLPATVVYPDGETVALTRDRFGRVTGTRVDGSLRTTYAYGADGSTTATDALGHTTTTWVDDTGAVAKVVDAAGRTTTVRRDAKGNPVGTIADGQVLGETVLTDAAGRVSAVVDPAGATTAIGLDVEGLLSAVTDPSGHRTSITRDASQRVTAVTDPAGRRSTVSYDSAGRPLTLTDRSGRRTTFGYAANDLVGQQAVPGYGTVTYTYDARRNMTSAVGPVGTTSMTWDAQDRLAGVTYPGGLGLTFGYDSLGRRVSTTTSDGQVTGVAYDSLGHLASVSANGAVITRYEYDALGQQTAIANANGTRTEITRNVLGFVTRQRTTCCTALGAAAGSTVVSDVQLTYDDQDRVSTRSDAEGTTSYSYDRAGRLSRAETTGAQARTLSYTYDVAGNRTSVTDSAGGTTDSVTGAAGRPTQVGADALTYDGAGRLTGKGADAYDWDTRGSLQSVTAAGQTTTYTYDALGTPLTRTTGGVTTRLLVDPAGIGSLVGEYSDAGARQAGYAWGQGISARLGADGNPSGYYVGDQRGDVVALTDGAGAVTDSYRYLPFGQVAGRTGSTVQPFGFEGVWGLRTDPTGLVNARSRTYDPALGRFLTDDPTAFASANAQTWASSDPMNRVDVGGRTESYLNAAYNNYGAQFLGFSSDAGSQNSNIANGAGYGVQLLDTLASGVASVEGPIAQGLLTLGQRNADMAADLVGDVTHLPGLGTPPATWTNARNTLLRQGKNFDNQGLKHYGRFKNASNASNALKGLGAALNVYQGYEAYKKDPSFANGVRQVSKAFLKTVAPPLIGLAFDTIEAGVDEGSLQALQWKFGVDPITAANSPDVPNSHWNAKNHLPKPKGGSGGADSSDPNAIVGPVGVSSGGTRFVHGSAVLPYTILFENRPDAALAAGEVVVTHTLDADLDLSTFELGTVGIGGLQWTAPPGSRAWSTLLDDRAQSGLMIRLKARLDLTSRQVTWQLTGIDPTTGDKPSDPTLGFLPPDATAPEGQGFLTFSVEAAESARNAATVQAQASIVFDANPAIDTAVDTVVLDSLAPAATPSVPAASSNPVLVNLGATDNSGGSGVAAAEVWVSKDGADFLLLAPAAPPAPYAFTGEVGSSYRFKVRPVDRVGNVGALSDPSGSVVVQPPPAPAGGGYTPLTPSRLLDTRTSGPCVSGASGRLLTVAGVGRVPAGAAAVAMNVTVVRPSAAGWLSVDPAGPLRSATSSLNYVRGQVVANLVLAKVGAGRQVRLLASAGCPHVVVDVVGWVAGGSAGNGGYTPVPPSRLLDTRSSGPCVSGPVGRLLTVAGVGPVPGDAAAVALNVTAVRPSAPGWLAVDPAGSGRPVTSSVNVARGQVVANLVLVKTGTGGAVRLFSSAGCPNVVVDVVGWFAGGSPAAGGYTALTPSRLLDTRSSGPCVSGTAGRLLKVAGVGRVPAGATAVAVNVTVVSPSAPGWLAVDPAGAWRSVSSSLNFVRGQTVANLVLAKVGDGGQIRLLASAGCPHVVVDVVGWYTR